MPGRRELLRAVGYAGLWVAGSMLPPVRAAGTPDEALRRRIATLRSAGDPRIGAGSAGARALLASLYEQRGFQPLWDDPVRAQALLAALETSRTHGLDPNDYHAAALGAPTAADPGTGISEAAAERDVLFTDALMRLAFHLHFGKADPRGLQPGWNHARTLGGIEPATALNALVAAPDPAAALESLAPQLPQYRNLRRALAGLRSIEQAGGWPRVSAGPTLEAGSTGDRVAELRARLRASGDLAVAAGDAEFDAELQDAVRRFQARHGLDADGAVGRATLAALNVGVVERVAQVRANLERLRWVARELAGDYLLVDIAGFVAELWLGDTLAWSSRVVVGRPFRKTPEFRARLAHLVLNPAWNVPPTILREDVLPMVARDRRYLETHAMRVVDRTGRPVDASGIDWPHYRDHPGEFPHRIVQAPGATNPLGHIKFMFPNEHSVYLHDTPSPELFAKAARAASSGCIRTERPLELARLLLDDPQRWSLEHLQEAIARGVTQTLPVRRAVPVLLLYFTAQAGSDGEPQFRPDLYDRDRPILRALAAPFRYAPVDAPAPNDRR